MPQLLKLHFVFILVAAIEELYLRWTATFIEQPAWCSLSAEWLLRINFAVYRGIGTNVHCLLSFYMQITNEHYNTSEKNIKNL